MKWTFGLTSILFLETLLVVPKSDCQIPSTGSDLPSLSKVKWGMSAQEVRGVVGRSTEVSSDSTLDFEDSFLDSRVEVYLTFGKYPDFNGLKIVEVQFADASAAERLLSYLKNRYGEKCEKQKQKKTKLFFTVEIESAKWLLEKEDVVLTTLFHESEVLSVSLVYGVREN